MVVEAAPPIETETLYRVEFLLHGERGTIEYAEEESACYESARIGDLLPTTLEVDAEIIDCRQ